MKLSYLMLGGFMSIVSLSACVQVDYYGKTFAENPNNVIVYYNRDEMPTQTYTVIGYGSASREEGSIWNTNEDAQKMLEKKAKAVGADAVLIGPVRRQLVNAVINDPYNYTTFQGHVYYEDFDDGIAQETDEYDDVINATFLKRKIKK